VSQWKYSALRVLPDSACRAILHRRSQGSWPRLREPRTFSEKVNWRILRDRRPDIAWTCDKLAMKERAAAVGGARIPATIWKGDDLHALAGLDLPERWVLKPNNGSGLVHIGHGSLSHAEASRLAHDTAGWLDPWQARYLREWAYTKAERVFVVEQFVEELGGSAPVDYKFHVFDGVVGFIQVELGRFQGHLHSRAFFSADWDRLDVSVGGLPPPAVLARPPALAGMTAVAQRVAAGFDFLRVDLYAPGGEIWFGEVSPYPGSGLSQIVPAAFDEEWGRLWALPSLTSLSAL
jgi:hypothetical protein